MADRKFIGLWIAVLVAVVLVFAGSAVWAEVGDKAERTSDTFQLGTSNCEAVIIYKNGNILKAITRNAFNPTDQGDDCYSDVTNRAKPISNFVVCNSPDLQNCQVLAAVEQTVMERTGSNSCYPVNTKTGQRLQIPLPPATTCP